MCVWQLCCYLPTVTLCALTNQLRVPFEQLLHLRITQWPVITSSNVMLLLSYCVECRYQPQLQQQQRCTVQRAEQAVALWGSSRVSNLGFPAYFALVAAYRLAGRNDKVRGWGAGASTFGVVRACRVLLCHPLGCKAGLQTQFVAR